MPDTALVAFLRKAKDSLNNIISSTTSKESIHIILGNESCDLDSVVSALCLGLLHHTEGKQVLAVLNIPQEEFALRTEVTYLLGENEIPSDILIFRDEVDLTALHAGGRLWLTLVDHHALPPADSRLAASLEAVVDHRPLDPEAARAFPDGCVADVRIVGSCASLVGERILARAPHLLDRQVANLIRGTILLDTACFSSQADRTTPLDVSVVEACEELGGMPSRADTFDRILSARKDVSSLTSFQILHKDMKLVQGLPLPGMPLLVRDFLKRPDATTALTDFCSKHGSDAAVVIGMSFAGEAASTLRRDLAVFGTSSSEPLVKQLTEALEAADLLRLVRLPTDVPGVVLYDQTDPKPSRKQILPIVRGALAPVQP